MQMSPLLCDATELNFLLLFCMHSWLVRWLNNIMIILQKNKNAKKLCIDAQNTFHIYITQYLIFFLNSFFYFEKKKKY